MHKKKKILMLGGSKSQLVAIEKAKKLGYFTIVCDYLKDNPGQYIADKFYLTSTTDKDAILEIAKKEKIDGIIAYSSDPAAPTAAFVANSLGLPGLDYSMVCNFCEKQRFRDFLKNNGFNTPQKIEINLPYDINKLNISQLRLPLIIKPTDSSGSKGVSVVNNFSELREALEYASVYSRNKTLIIEEFIERDHPYVIEAEIFTKEGVVVSWGLINSIRDNKSNPLLPAAYSYPLDLSDERKALVKNEISKLISLCGKPTGAFNIEMIIDKDNRLFFLDAGPRNGGNMLPEWISMIAGKDIVDASIKNAMGDANNLNINLDGENGGFWGLGVLHSPNNGKFKQVNYSDTAKKALIREDIQKHEGDNVNAFCKCNDLVGLSFFKFKTKEDRDKVMSDFDNSMKVILSNQ